MSEPDRLIAGRYRLQERIGGGAMGVVWRAADEVLFRQVAVKQFLPQAGLDSSSLEEARERVRREARITARLQHPNAVTVFDEVEQDGLPYLVMEYVPSQSLAAVLEHEGSLAPGEVARIGSRVAAALAAAHRVGVVHRDVKPANVLMAEDGMVKLADFGISRAVGDVVLTATGLVSGTPAYLAPELANGEMPSPQSDAFSLGATLYAAVEGEPPFGIADNALAALHRVATGQVRAPQRAGPLTEVLSGLLRREPEARISVDEAARALTELERQVGAQDTVSAAPVGAMATMNSGQFGRYPSNPVGPPPPGSVPLVPEATLGAHMPAPRSVRRKLKRARKHSRFKEAVALVAALVIGGALITAFVLSGSHNGHNTVNQAAASSSQQGTSSAGGSSSGTGDPAKTTDVKAFLIGYYALLPNHIDKAFTLLTPRYRDANGGLAAFRGFYQTIAAVKVANVQVTGTHSAVATLVFTKRSGGVSTEVYRFTVVAQNGGLAIDSATLERTL